MRIDPTSIKPAVRGKADFWSWQLYRWVRHNPQFTQVWSGTWNFATGIDRNKPVLYIGHMDDQWGDGQWLHGTALRSLCLVGQPLRSAAYGPAFDTVNWTDMTAEWWDEYRRIGVCAIHGDNAHNWSAEGKTRVCSYCGKRERQTIQMVERSKWVAA